MTWIKVASAVAIAAALFGTGWKAASSLKHQEVLQLQMEWEQERARMANAHAEELMKARQSEQSLQALADRLRKEKADEARRIAAQYSADLERLRNRPEARAEGPYGLPAPADAGVGCTGQGLARGDAQFLAGYAADAARLQAALRACQAAYDAANVELSGER